jgi:hypothetical protein
MYTYILKSIYLYNLIILSSIKCIEIPPLIDLSFINKNLFIIPSLFPTPPPLFNPILFHNQITNPPSLPLLPRVKLPRRHIPAPQSQMKQNQYRQGQNREQIDETYNHAYDHPE